MTTRSVFLALLLPLTCGLSAPLAAEPPLTLDLRGAVTQGLAHHLGLRLADQDLQKAKGAAQVEISALLPHIGAELSETRQQINFEEFGMPAEPPVVGPFNVFAVRLGLSQTLFDPVQNARVRAGREGMAAAESNRDDQRRAVAYICAVLYLRASALEERVVDARLQHQTAQRLLERARVQKAAGTVPGIEVLRAEVEEQAQRQRVIYFQAEAAKSRLDLGRAVGLPPGTELVLAAQVGFAPLDPQELPLALARARERRADLRSLEHRIAAAQQQRKAAKAERLPVGRFNAHYARSGPEASDLERTFATSFVLAIPLFEGGRSAARAQEAEAQIAKLEAQRDDLLLGIDQEVRAAFLDLNAADERARVAQRTVELAQEQLRQAEDRFAAGVASNLEVVQA